MKHLSSLNKYFWKYRWHFMLGFVFIILTNYFRIPSPQLTGYVVNTVVHSIKAQQGGKAAPAVKEREKNYDFAVQQVITKFEEDPANKILYAGLTLFVIAIISGFFMFLMRQTIIVMSRHIEYDQKNEIYNHYQKLDTAFFKTHHTGDLMNRIAEDVSRVRMFTGPALLYLANLIAIISLSVFFMLKRAELTSSPAARRSRPRSISTMSRAARLATSFWRRVTRSSFQVTNSKR